MTTQTLTPSSPPLPPSLFTPKLFQNLTPLSLHLQLLTPPSLFNPHNNPNLNPSLPFHTHSFQHLTLHLQLLTLTCTHTGINPHDNPDLNPELSFNFVPVDSIVTNFLDFTPELLGFVQCNMKQQITSAASSLHDAHARCLQTLILYAHDLTRDVMVTPKRIKYARNKEEELYTQLIDLASRKQSEIKELVCQAIVDATDDIVTQVRCPIKGQ